MPFQISKFEAAKFEPRTARVAVPGLARWFDEGEEAVWIVRGLTCIELNVALEAAKRAKDVGSIVEAISQSGDVAERVRAALGLGKQTPAEIAKRIELLVAGSIEPTMTHALAAKLGESFPVEFLQLTNEITALTGQGHDVAKPEAASQSITSSAP